MAVTIILEGGPSDGKSFVLENYPPVFVTVKPLPTYAMLNSGPLGPAAERCYYERVGNTDRYVCTEWEPVQEAINFMRRLGMELTEWQERMFRDWWTK